MQGDGSLFEDSDDDDFVSRPLEAEPVPEDGSLLDSNDADDNDADDNDADDFEESPPLWVSRQKKSRQKNIMVCAMIQPPLILIDRCAQYKHHSMHANQIAANKQAAKLAPRKQKCSNNTKTRKWAHVAITHCCV